VNQSYKNPIYVAVYLDDLITAGKQSTELTNFRKSLHKEFNMSDGGKLEWYLGCCFNQTSKGWTIDQNQYVSQKLVEFKKEIGVGMRSSPLPGDLEIILEEAENSEEYEKDFPYRNMVGSLMYAMVGMRLDIAFAVSVVSRYLHIM
jgi:hypothetical protein